MHKDASFNTAVIIREHFQFQNWHYRFDPTKCKEGNSHKIYFLSNEVFKTIPDPSNSDPIVAAFGRFDPLSEDELNSLPNECDFRNRILRVVSPNINPRKKTETQENDKLACLTFSSKNIPIPKCYWSADKIDPMNSKNTNFWVYEKMDIEATTAGWANSTNTYESLTSLDQSLLTFVKDILKNAYDNNDPIVEDFYSRNVMYSNSSKCWAIVDQQTNKRNKKIEKIAKDLIQNEICGKNKQEVAAIIKEKIYELINNNFVPSSDQTNKYVEKFIEVWSSNNQKIKEWLTSQIKSGASPEQENINTNSRVDGFNRDMKPSKLQKKRTKNFESQETHKKFKFDIDLE